MVHGSYDRRQKNETGKPGKDGANRQTGGGGSGSTNATGASITGLNKTTAAFAYGGKGGNGTSYSGGNSGEYASASAREPSVTVRGEAGSDLGGKGGGLLIIYGNNISNSGKIYSNGNIPTGNRSGGGSINIFYKEQIVEGTIQAIGGIDTLRGGNGGNGTVTINNIEDTPIIANEPNIDGFDKNKTYYVTWDLTSSPYEIQETNNLTESEPSNWYNYKSGVNHWANVKTTGGENDCYWVWIPRYAYKVPTKGNTAQTIDIKFLRGTTNEPLDGSIITISNNSTEGSWNIHPAFLWDKNNNGIIEEEQLTGIWVAKYEASSIVQML